MKPISRRFSVLHSILGATIFAGFASMSAQAQQYWDQNSVSPSIDLENGTFSSDQAGLDITDYSNSPAFAGDVIFSSDLVTSSAQTILLDDKEDPGQGYVVSGFEFATGSITLQDDPSNKAGSALFIGDDGITMDAGTGAASVSSPTLYIDDAESWNNNSSASLTVGGALEAAYSSSALSFYGQGNGSVNITGTLSSGIGIDQESATSTLYLSNVSNSGLTSININKGTVVATDMGPEPTYNYQNAGSLGGNSVPIDIENGGTLTILGVVGQTPDFNRTVNITDGGTLNFNGDVLLGWSSGQVTADTLTLGSGDDLDTSTGSQHIGTLDLNVGSSFSRLIVGINGQGLGFLNGISAINVGTGYILDFGSSGTVAGAITFASGSALEARNNANVTMTDATLPIGGTLIFGNDDVGSTSNFYITNDQVLTGTTTFIENGTPVSLILNGNLTGSGGLAFTAQNTYYGYGSPVVLDGTNTYSGPTVLGSRNGNNFPVVEINGNSSGIGNEIDVKSGRLILGANAQLPTGSVISLGDPNSASNSDPALGLQIGDGSVATSATVYDVVAASTWNNSNDAGADQIIGTAAGATLTWDVEGASTTDHFGGHIGDGSTGGNNITIVKTGTGTLLLTGSSGYTGGTIIDNGTVAIFGGENFGADQSAVGAGYSNGNFGAPTVTLNNGASTLLDLNAGLGVNVVTGTAGTVTIDGDTLSIAGQLNFSGDEGVYGQLLAGPNGGTGLAFVGGDALVYLNSIPTAGNLYVENAGTRVLMINNNNLLGGTGYSVTVGNGAVLDFGMGGSPVVNLPVIMENGSDLGDRGTNVTINDLVVPTTSSSGTPYFSIGTDDSGGGSITVANNIALTNNLQIDGAQFDGRSLTYVNFSGGFSGTGNLTVDTAPLSFGTPITQNHGFVSIWGADSYQGDTIVQGGVLDLNGDNTAVTSAGGGAPNYYVFATTKTYVDNSSNTHSVYTPGVLQVGNNAKLASDANIVLGNATGFGYFAIGDNNGAANVTVGSITTGAGDNGAIVGGANSNSTLTVDLAANATDNYAGAFGSSFNYNLDSTIDNGSNGLVSLNSARDNLGIVFDLASGSRMILSAAIGSDNLNGGFTVNGTGVLQVGDYLHNGVNGDASNVFGNGGTTVTLNNTEMDISNWYAQGVYGHFDVGSAVTSYTIVGLDGIDAFSGDIQAAGKTVHIDSPNQFMYMDGTASNIGTLDIDGGRTFLLGSNGLNLIANNAVVNVAGNGAGLDFATDTMTTVNNEINFASGSQLVLRNNNTNITLTNANLPTAGSFSVGSDDVGGTQNSSYTITSGLALTGDLDLHVIANSYVPVTLAGNISGNGGITVDSGGYLYLTGTNSYSGQTSAIFANLFIDGNNSGAGPNYFSNFAPITIGHGGSIASDANLLFGNGSGYGIFILGDGNGAVDQTVAALVMESSGTSYVYNGDTKDSTDSVLTVNPSSGNDVYTGILGNSGATNGNNLALVKSGAGTLTLTGANTYTGGTTVAGGKLAVNGSIAGNAVVNLGAELGGSGSIAGKISGAGAVGPGNSPGILTASQVDPSGGLSFNFELTQAGAPNYSSSSASGNDVLHLELASMPFISPLTASNAVNVYLSGNGTFEGGFFVNGSTDPVANAADGVAFAGNLATADFVYYIADPYGNVTYNGQKYALASALGGIELTSIVDVSSANFADGTVNGYDEQFQLTGAVIPEPSTYALMGVAGLAFLFIRRRLKA
jgi:fibronectin-binding autotransporter adhesin